MDQIAGDMMNGIIKGQSLYMVNGKKFTHQKIEIVLTWFLQIPQIMTCMALVKFKNTKDVLQGVSKLDYLQKISKFQKFSHNIRKWNGEIGTQDEVENFIVNLETIVNADGSVSVHGHLESSHQFSHVHEIIRYDTDRHSFELIQKSNGGDIRSSRPRPNSFL